MIQMLKEMKIIFHKTIFLYVFLSFLNKGVCLIKITVKSYCNFYRIPPSTIL